MDIMHQVIVSTNEQNRVQAASRHVQNLQQKGLIQGECLLLDGNMFAHEAPMSFQTLETIRHMIEEHKKGAVIFDNVYDTSDSLLVGSVIAAFVENGSGPAFVLTGRPERMEEFLGSTRLRDKLPVAVSADNTPPAKPAAKPRPLAPKF